MKIKKFNESFNETKEFTLSGRLELSDGVLKIRNIVKTIDGTIIKSGKIDIGSLKERGWKNGDDVNIKGHTENGEKPKFDNPILLDDIGHDKEKNKISNVKYCSQCGNSNNGVTDPHSKFCGNCGARKILTEGYIDHIKIQTFGFFPR